MGSSSSCRTQSEVRCVLSIFHNIYYATNGCSRNVQMSVPSQLEMSVSAVVWRAAGGDVGGGAEHERWGAAASRGVAGRRLRWSAGWSSGAAVGAQRAPGMAAVEGVSGRGCAGADLEETRPAEQSQDF